MNNPNNNQNQGDNGNRNRQSLLILLICVLVSLICMSVFSGAFDSASTRKITYDQFISMLDKGEVESVVINQDTIDIIPKKAPDARTTITYYTTRTEDLTALTYLHFGHNAISDLRPLEKLKKLTKLPLYLLLKILMYLKVLRSSIYGYSYLICQR